MEDLNLDKEFEKYVQEHKNLSLDEILKQNFLLQRNKDRQKNLGDSGADAVEISIQDIQQLLNNEESTIDLERLRESKDLYTVYLMLKAIFS